MPEAASAAGSAHATPASRGRWASDLWAGLTVALVGLPQCLAYALMSGLPPAYGLSTAVAAGAVAAVAGRSAQVITGPTNTTGLLVLAALAPYLGANGLLDPAGLPVLAALTLLAVVLRLAAALAGGAQLMRFIPESVLVGFTAGAGVLIGVMQLDEALGIAGVRGANLVDEAVGLASAAGHVQGLAVLVAGATALVLAATRRASPKVPAALAAVLAVTGIAWVTGLDARSGLPLVGDRAVVPSGWPAGAWPSFDPQLLRTLLVPASAIVLLGTLELTVTARAGGARPDMTREIHAQGWANVAGSLVGTFPASASLTRSALLRLGGGRTRLAAFSAAIFTAPFVFFGGGLVERIPQACLAGVLLYTAFRMIDRRAMARLWRATPDTRLLLVVTLVSTLLLPLEWAILVGSGIGLVIHLARTSAPRLRLLRAEGPRLVPVLPGEAAPFVVIEVSGDLHYAAVPPFVDEAERLRDVIDRATLRALSPQIKLPKSDEAACAEDLRDEVTRWTDGVLLATATLPSWAKRRLEAAFDQILQATPARANS